MPHAVMGRRLGWVENAATSKAPWHTAHTPIKLGMTASEANVVLQMNFGISKLPSFVDIPDSKDRILTGYSIVRHPVHDDPKWRHFANVGESYVLLQNAEIAQIVDILIDSGRWRLETCGALEQGKTLFYLLQTSESWKIATDEHKHYVAITDRRDGLAALRVFPTLVRMECMNTVNLAWSKVENEIAISHTSGMLQEFEWRTDLIARATAAGQALADVIRGLESVTTVNLPEYLETIFPEPKAPKGLDLVNSGKQELIEKGERIIAKYDYDRRKVIENRELVMANIEYLQEERPELPMGYVAFNGLTAYTSHQVNTSREVRFRNSLVGNFRDIQTKAVKYLLGDK